MPVSTVTAPTTTPEDVLRRVDEDHVEFIRLWFTDINGQLKSFSVGREELDGALAEGMGFDGSSITGFNAIEESDMIAMPDPDTYTVLPWRTHGEKGNVARMFCDVLKPGGEPYEGDPRFVMRRALARAKDMEEGDLAVHGHEVYPSDVPSLAFPSGVGSPAPVVAPEASGG